MTRHSALLQEAAGKEKAARDKHDQLLKLANQAEKARQDALAKGREDMDALKQAYEVRENSWKLLIGLSRMFCSIFGP